MSDENGCQNTKNITVVGRNVAEKSAMFFHPRCKQWSCDYCAEINKDYWIHQAARGSILITSEERDLQFVTLTSRKYTTQNSSLYFLKQNWPKLNRRAKYHTEKTTGAIWSYFLVPEHHQSGVAHFHMIAATPLSGAKWWHDTAWQTGFGYIVDVQPMIDAQGASAYVAKYLHKGSGGEVWPKGFMRVRHSRNWPMAKERPLEGWEWETIADENTVWIEKNALLNMGWNVVDKT